MAFFGRKKDEESNGAEGGGSDRSPQKAAKFFEHARTVHDTTNYEYAMQSWLSGLKLDWGSMEGIKGFFASCAAFLAESNGKKSASKGIYRTVSGKTDVDKFLAAILDWGMKPEDQMLAVRAAETCAKLAIAEPTNWIAPRAMATVERDKKPRKDLLLKIRDAFSRVGSFDAALRAAEAAYRIDPADGALGAEIRNLAAQSTMARGGFDQTGESGGFRANIRDADRQRQLEAQDKIVKTVSEMDVLVAAAEAEYNRRPDDLPTITVLCKRLVERGRPEDELRAEDLLLKAWQDSGQFRFRKDVGDIRLRRAQRALSELRANVEANPGEAAAADAFKAEQRKFWEMEIQELQARIEAYPTDLGLKFELGKRYFALDRFDDAVGMFQEAQHDAKNRAPVMNLLGQSFVKLGYTSEAVEMFRQGLTIRDLLPEMERDLQYGLLMALQGVAAEDRSLTAAEEAEKIASAILVKQFTYRDVRARRDELKKLIAELKGKPA